MARIPDRCWHFRVSNFLFTSWWCKAVCGYTGGRLCRGWCLIVERFGLWTLAFTVAIPLILVLWGIVALLKMI
ncbi:MAG: hypothetical protein ACUVXI_07785 [bacterium]